MKSGTALLIRVLSICYLSIVDIPFVIVDNRQMEEDKYLSRQPGHRQM